MPTGACRARRWSALPFRIRACGARWKGCFSCRRTSPRIPKQTGRSSSASPFSGRRASSSSTLRAARSRACASSATSRRIDSSRPLAPSLAIDHAVIAVRDLDAAAASFRALGFTLTPRGHHSIGSQNHCLVFGSTYIELLAAPKPHPWLDYYRTFVESGEGLAAIALSTDDADQACRDLRAQGVDAKQPMDLSRPVEGGVARFRLVRMEGLPYVFVCQHLTAELVWKAQWQRHANGATELASVSLPMAQPFALTPANVQWATPAQLRLRGNGRAAEAHGVRLAFD